MPWSETSPLHERERFIRDYRSVLYGITELGWSRAPKRCPHRMDERAVRAIVEARRLHPSGGPKKLVARLAAARVSPMFPVARKIDAFQAKGESPGERPRAT